MKKLISIISVLALLCSLFTACGKSKRGDTLRILIDVEGHYERDVEAEMESLLTRMANRGYLDEPWQDKVEIEFLYNYTDPHMAPDKAIEIRKGQLTRLKTEIAAGRGPDIFLISNGTSSLDYNLDMLFQYPAGVMAQHRFLKLDDYIEKAEFMEWDELEPTVMSAGRNEEGQYLIPMSYTFPATIYNMEGVEEDPMNQLDRTTTWEDMLNSDDPMIRRAATLQIGFSHNRVSSIIGPTDDGHENMTFTSEELEAIYDVGVEQGNQNLNMVVDGQVVQVEEDDTVPENFSVDMAREFDQQYVAMGRQDASQWDMTIVPLCSRDGGVTATVSSYCAISANTADPDLAFRIVDFMMSKENMQKRPLYTALGNWALPVYRGLMSEDERVYGQAYQGYWWLPEGNYQAFTRATDLITQAKLMTSADNFLDMGLARYMYPGDYEDPVQWACREIKMGLAES